MTKARLSPDAKALLRALRKEWASAREETKWWNEHVLQTLEAQQDALGKLTRAVDVLANEKAAEVGWEKLLDGRRVRQIALEEQRRAERDEVAAPPSDASQGPSRDSGGNP